jgi:hypothetical protein
MPTQVRLHQLSDLSNEESPEQIYLDTNLNTQINIRVEQEKTIITLPYGNKFDIINGSIIIHEK